MPRKKKDEAMDMQAFLQQASQATATKTRYFALPGLLPENCRLSLYSELGTLSLLMLSEDGPQLVAEQKFTLFEMNLLLPLLESYPDYCPYEVLYAAHTRGNTAEKTVERARKELATAGGNWDALMRPVRNLMSRNRLKLNKMGLNSRSLLETGYMLIPMKKGQING